MPAVKGLSSPFINPSRLLFLLMLPVLLAVVAFSVRTASGPYWYSENLDPSYPYLLNSLNISNLHRPYHIAHPGTPIQTIGAVIIRAWNPAADERTRAREVLSNSEAYLRLINNVFIILGAVCLLGSGFVVFRISGDILSALVIQSAPFLSPTTMQGLFGVRPEPFLVSLSVVFSAVILLTLKFEARRHALKYSVAFGVLAGLGMASKINFLPLLTIPLILLPIWKWRAVYVVATGLSFLLFTAPILTPGQLAVLLGFAIDISTHTGLYGKGATGIVDASQFLRNAWILIATDWLFFLIVAIGTLLLVTKSKYAPLDGGRYRILLAVTIAQFLEFLIVAKHPSSRYLIPALGLAGVNLVILFDSLRRSALNARWRYASLTAACVAITFAQVFEFKKQHDRLRSLAARQHAASEKVEQEFKTLQVVYYYSASSPAYALKFGAEYSFNLYPSILEKLYPGSLFYTAGTQQFSNFEGPVEVMHLKSSGDPFIMRGYSLKDSDFQKLLPAHAFPENLILEPIYGGDVDVPWVYDGEAVYRAAFRPAKAPGYGGTAPLAK